MEQTLKTLQDLQMKAFKKGIRQFEINARRVNDDEGEYVCLAVYVLLCGDNSEGDYGSFRFYDDIEPARNQDQLHDLLVFIGE